MRPQAIIASRQSFRARMRGGRLTLADVAAILIVVVVIGLAVLCSRAGILDEVTL